MIVAALLVRNEADRYLERCVRNALRFCDAIVALDDHSTDNTAEVIRATARDVNKPVVVLPVPSRKNGQERGTGWWGENETPARAALWDLAQVVATRRGTEEGWVYVFDADHELEGITPTDFRMLCRSTKANSWLFPLWDCWDSDELMRIDGFWQAHFHPRPWLFKVPEGFVPQWGDKSIHTGHFPQNYPLVPAKAPGMAAIRHLGYVNEKDRKKKARKYLRLTTLNDRERAHAQSILEPPTLMPIPTKIKPKVLVASIVRKPQVVVDALLKTVEGQIADAEVDYHFVANYAANEEVPSFGKHEVAKAGAPEGDYGDGEITRKWTSQAFERVALLKDHLIDKAKKEDYDFLWLVDADVLCDKYTLQSMLDCETAIVSAVYWTQWQLPREGLKNFVHAGPQVWQRGAYDLSGRLTEAEFRHKLMAERVRMTLPEGGLGACTLIRRDALEKGVSFRFFSNNPMGAGGMAQGEDRHFCARAHALHIPLVADAWPDIYHAYHVAHYERIPEMLERLTQEHPTEATFGDLVSMTIELLEPVRIGDRMVPVGKRWVRGALGKLPVLPQVEEALIGMERGDVRLLRVHFPMSWPVVQLRGDTRLLRISLLDCKPFGFPPVVEDEMLYDRTSRRYIDTSELKPEQLSAFFDDQESGRVAEGSEDLEDIR